MAAVKSDGHALVYASEIGITWNKKGLRRYDGFNEISLS